jgi:D-aminopeptidase
MVMTLLALAVSPARTRAQHVDNAQEYRPRARDLGIRPGIYEPGTKNAITDVPGVLVGQTTISEGESVRTGVTAILPHSGNLFQDKVAGGVYVYNAFGKLVGSTQINELGQIETPIVLTNTLSVWDAASAVAAWTLAQPGNERVGSVNPVVGETNDGWLNDIRGFHVKAEHIRRALTEANNGPVEEGALGAGAGTIAFGWKGGIGTSSRRLPQDQGGFTLGVLLQTNFGGRLTIAGVPVWKELRPTQPVRGQIDLPTRNEADGSTGSSGSGDFVIAFSTTNRVAFGAARSPAISLLGEDALSPLFEALMDATEEAIDNSLLKAHTVRGRDGHVAEAIPIDRLQALLASARGVQ